MRRFLRRFMPCSVHVFHICPLQFACIRPIVGERMEGTLGSDP